MDKIDSFVNNIICGDSKEILKKMPDSSVDIVLTSPPYNFDMKYNSYDDNKKINDYFNLFLFPILSECYRVLKDDGRMIINVQPLYSQNTPTHHIISNYLTSLGMLWKGEIIWDKNTYNCAYTCWGSYKSPSSPYLKYTYEFIEVFCKKDKKKAGKLENIDITEDEFKDWVTARWSFAPEHRMKNFGHPAMFPEELPKRCLKLFSYKGDIVLDPFNGLGTTCVVAKRLNRKFIGIDISDEYCKKAELRVGNTAISRELFNE